MNPKVRVVLDAVVERFSTGDIPTAIAMSMFPIPDIPAGKWSLLNRTVMFMNGTSDARGFNQWKQARRYVKKGAKAFHILVPAIKTIADQETSEEKRILAGFLVAPVFRVEDTEGEPLEYQKLELPELPLMEKAQEWGITVKAIPGNYSRYGYYSQERGEIGLATQEESVFFHELSHAAHQRVLGCLRPGQHWDQEVVAELSAAVLCQLTGKTSRHLGNSYRYIDDYARKAGLTPVSACLRVMADVEKVLELVLKAVPAAVGLC